MRISNSRTNTHTHLALFTLLRFQKVLLRSVYLDVLPLLSDQLGVSISSPRKRVCGFNWPFDLHRFDLILTERRGFFSPGRLLFPPCPGAMCMCVVWMGVYGCMLVLNNREESVCAIQCVRASGVGFRVLPWFLSSIFYILWRVLGDVVNTVTLGQCVESIVSYLCGLPVDVYRQVWGIIHTHTQEQAHRPRLAHTLRFHQWDKMKGVEDSIVVYPRRETSASFSTSKRYCNSTEVKDFIYQACCKKAIGHIS